MANNMGEKFLEILKTLEEEEKHRSDIIIPMKHLKMTDTGNIETIDGRNLNLGEHAFNQFCTELNMPSRYMRRLINEKPDFVAQQANYFLSKFHDDEKRRLRLIDNKVQGIVSERYVPYDDVQLFEKLYEISPKLPEGEITSFYRDDKRTQMKIRFPEISKNVGISEENGKDDLLSGGITIQNSMVAASILKAVPLVWRMVCTNGMMGFGESENKGLRQRHIHFEPASLTEQIEDGILVAIKITKDLMHQMELSRDVRVDNPLLEIEKYGKEIKLTKKQIQEVKRAYHFEAQDNLYGIINSFTRFARDSKNNELQTDIELFAGSLLKQIA